MRIRDLVYDATCKHLNENDLTHQGYLELKGVSEIIARYCFDTRPPAAKHAKEIADFLQLPVEEVSKMIADEKRKKLEAALQKSKTEVNFFKKKRREASLSKEQFAGEIGVSVKELAYIEAISNDNLNKFFEMWKKDGC